MRAADADTRREMLRGIIFATMPMFAAAVSAICGAIPVARH